MQYAFIISFMRKWSYWLLTSDSFNRLLITIIVYLSSTSLKRMGSHVITSRYARYADTLWGGACFYKLDNVIAVNSVVSWFRALVACHDSRRFKCPSSPTSMHGNVDIMRACRLSLIRVSLAARDSSWGCSAVTVGGKHDRMMTFIVSSRAFGTKTYHHIYEMIPYVTLAVYNWWRPCSNMMVSCNTT